MREKVMSVDEAIASMESEMSSMEQIIDDRIVFLEFIKRKLTAETKAQKEIYFNDVDLHKELDDELKEHIALIDKWLYDFERSRIIAETFSKM